MVILKKESFDYLENEQNFVLFESAEEAWFWYCRCESMNDGLRLCNSYPKVMRVCNVNDIYIIVSKLYIAKRISERHLKTLIKYGREQVVPDGRVYEQRDEALWWEDAMDKLEAVFRSKGIVRCIERD